MIVAIDSRFLRGSFADTQGYFIYEVFLRIAREHPSHEFIFISDRRFVIPPFNTTNIRFIIAGPGIRNIVTLKWWLDITLPQLLKKYAADVFVSADVCCSLRSPVPQVIIIHDREEIEPGRISKTTWRIFYRRYLTRFMKKAVKIITFSKGMKDFILDRFPVGPAKMILTSHAAHEHLEKTGPDEKKLIKEKYSSSKEYFLYAGPLTEKEKIVYLLRAFSFFKKRQQTGMQLVLLGTTRLSETLKQLLKSYKYRADIKIVDMTANQVIPLIGSAYGLIGIARFQPFAFPFPEALVLGTPMIATVGSAMQEKFSDAVLYADPEDPASLAEQMMTLYKDENRRNEMIARQSAVVDRSSWDITAKDVWNAIVK